MKSPSLIVKSYPNWRAVSTLHCMSLTLSLAPWLSLAQSSGSSCSWLGAPGLHPLSFVRRSANRTPAIPRRVDHPPGTGGGWSLDRDDGAAATTKTSFWPDGLQLHHAYEEGHRGDDWGHGKGRARTAGEDEAYRVLKQEQQTGQHARPRQAGGAIPISNRAFPVEGTEQDGKQRQRAETGQIGNHHAEKVDRSAGDAQEDAKS